MKVLTIKIEGKTYTTSRVTAHIAKEAMKINKQATELMASSNIVLSIDENATELSSEEMAAINELSNATIDLLDRKINLICEVYGNKFTADAIENNFTNEEIDIALAQIMGGITGVMQKNA